VRKRGKSFFFKTFDYDRKLTFYENPLILLDGVPIFQADEIMNYDPLNVEKIDIIGRKYYLGPEIFDGIVSFQTYDGNLPGFKLAGKALKIKRIRMMPEKIYYMPVYDGDNKDMRIPDFRTQLYWSPKIENKNGVLEFEFYTGDDIGSYEVVAEGISPEGKLISTRSYFEVKEKSVP
jgi:hypothetical protein